MKTKIPILIGGVIILAGMAIWQAVAYRYADDRAVAGNEEYRLDDSTYAQLATSARTGDCDAAYRLGRHHMFFSLNMEEAARWYRIAAKCPHSHAKGELVVVLMYDPRADKEVDRLLSELEQLDPEAAKGDRREVARVRATRDPRSR